MAIRRAFAVLSVVLIASAFAAQETRAEFQALGIVATKVPAPMQCQNGHPNVSSLRRQSS